MEATISSAQDDEQIVSRFLDYACPDHRVRGRPAHAMARAAAVRILEQNPQIARHDFYTAIVCGELEEVARMLRDSPDLARRKKEWEPLLYLCFTRLPIAKSTDNAVAIAKLLLDSGADPDVYFMAGDSRYTPLVGVIGEGEEDRPPHPHRDELARLLLERGAKPYDTQVIYNVHFHGPVLWFLKLIHEFSPQRDWDDPEWKMLDMGRYGSGARYHLWTAIRNRDIELAEWCLVNGASPNVSPGNLYEEAVRSGNAEIATLLLRYGADFVEVEESPESIFDAAKRDLVDLVKRFLDTGVSIEIENEKKQRPLHIAAANNALKVAALLIERGAAIDPREENWHNTPLDFAVYHEYPQMVDLLAPHSRDVWNLVFARKVARLREVLGTEPELAKVTWGETPLFRLPDDEPSALEIIDLFVRLGADAGFRRKDGKTAADIARQRGLNWAAAKLEAAVVAAPYAIEGSQAAPRRVLTVDEWDALLGEMKEKRVTRLESKGLVTDEALRRIAALDHVTSLDLGGCRHVTDAGLMYLAGMPQLEELRVSGKLTDRGLEVLRHLPELRRFEMTWQSGISDLGAGNLRVCEKLEHVDLMGSPTGDGVIEALRGKPHLHRLQTGRLVTDAGLAMLHGLPLQHLLIDGPFTNAGLAGLEGLDELYGLDLFWHVTGITTDAYEVLTRLPNLGFLGCDGELSDDRAMRHIAAMPKLRKLRAQSSVATDEGFIALSRSQSLEDLWGRRSPNLTGRGFAALSKMPSLKTLGISCLNVDDEALATLADFPALRDFTPIDVRDEGFQHIAKCEQLERLVCMYCADTTDVATEHVRDLELKSYYAGQTKITDRSLEILGGMRSLEELEFSRCEEISDNGVPFLASLPKLRPVQFTGCPKVNGTYWKTSLRNASSFKIG